MNTRSFLEKYYKMMEHIYDEDACCDDNFIDVLTDFFDIMSDYCNIVVVDIEERGHIEALDTIRELINKCVLPLEEFKVPDYPTYIFFRRDNA